jgi:Spy/CpxP family protein refolding chaperone
MKNMDGTKDPARADKMEKHTAALKDVLTPEQHSKWVAWCNERTTKTQVDQ